MSTRTCVCVMNEERENVTCVRVCVCLSYYGQS